MKKIPENVMEVLGGCRVEGQVLYLPEGQLDRETYEAVNKVLTMMGGKWNRKARGHVFPETADPAELLDTAMLTGEVRDTKQEFQFFPTPRKIAERMCELAELDGTCHVCEPSCGDGRLADVIMEHHPASLVGVELNPDMLRALAGKPYEVIFEDFLKLGREDIGTCDRMVMNPPFTRQQDIDHILHAYELLEDGGILVSIISESPFFRQDRKSRLFRDFLAEVGANTVELPDGAFRESGTGVRTRMLVITKERER